MEDETDRAAVEAEELPPVPSPAAMPGRLGRLIAALISAPESESELPRLRRLLLPGLGLTLALEIASFFRFAWGEPAALPVPLVLRIFSIGLTCVGLSAIPLMRSARGWRWWVMAFCVALVIDRTMVAIAVNEDDPLLLTLFVVILGSALFVPWNVRWQGALALINLAAGTVLAAYGLIRPRDVERWTILTATTAFAVSFTALKDYYQRQKLLIGELRSREEKLRTENAHRRRAEIRLRTEVADREAAQHAAQDREATLRKIFEANPDAVVVAELASGRILDVNGKFVAYGYGAEEAVGKTFAELNLWVEPAQAIQYRSLLQDQGHADGMEARLRTKSGEIRDFLISGAVVELDSQPCVLSITHDISDRKAMERDLIAAREKALAASKAKSEFLSSMSHEIRTPMNAVLGMADLLQETDLNPEQRRYLEVMTANGNSLLELINGILDLARIESGRLQIEKADFDLADLIDKTISTFGVRAHGKGLELVARIAPGVPGRLVGDALRLRQVLLNLLGNAIKFTEKGEVVLEVEREPGSNEATEIRFTVSDTGIGIAPDKLGSIFSSFTQADSSTTRKYGGTGLGLAIAERLVGLMEGRIWVESEINKGSRFSFTARFSLAGRVISPTSHVVLSLTGYRVLVVDDNQINRLIVREMVSSCGAEVSEAESGEAALTAIRQATSVGQPYRIILLDMRMPGMNGLEVAKIIRHEKLPTQPLILMLSSDDFRPQLARLKELGLDAYLVKPITRKELFEAIFRVIEDANRNSADTLPKRGARPAALVPAAEPVKTRILVADDSTDNRLLIGAYLRREPYQVDFAEDGKQAVEKFTANRYELVFTDIQMPEMDGLDATRAIRKWESEHRLDPTPIIALTAFALEEDVQRILAAGCDAHVAKPVKKRVLLDAIANAALLRRAGEPRTPAPAESPSHSESQSRREVASSPSSLSLSPTK